MASRGGAVTAASEKRLLCHLSRRVTCAREVKPFKIHQCLWLFVTHAYLASWPSWRDGRAGSRGLAARRRMGPMPSATYAETRTGTAATHEGFIRRTYSTFRRDF